MYKIGVIGDRESILGFKAVGLTVFPCDEAEEAKKILKQIDEKGYLIPYQKDHREIIKIGVEFSAETRNINRWLVETR